MTEESFDTLMNAYNYVILAPIKMWSTADLVQLSLRINSELQQRAYDKQRGDSGVGSELWPDIS